MTYDPHARLSSLARALLTLSLTLSAAPARAGREYGFEASCENALLHLRAGDFTVVCAVATNQNLSATFNDQIKTIQGRLGKPLKVGRLVLSLAYGEGSTVMMCAKVRVDQSRDQD